MFGHHRIYLSGPLSGITIREATEWRTHVRNSLEEYAEILDPLRDVFGDPDHIITEQLPSVDPAMMTDRGIYVRDFNDTITATVVIVNLLGARSRSIGTIFELAWAWQARVPLIVIMEPTGNIHEHPFVREATAYRVDTVERAITVAKSLMNIDETQWGNDEDYQELVNTLYTNADTPGGC